MLKFKRVDKNLDAEALRVIRLPKYKPECNEVSLVKQYIQFQ